MRVALVLAGDIESESGGFYYDRRLRDRLRERGHAVEVVSLPRGSYRERLAPNLRARRLADRLAGFDVVVEDGLAHPSVLCANRRLDAPTVALVHMIAWRARAAQGTAVGGGVGPGGRLRTELGRRGVAAVERRFLRGVDAAVYNAETTRRDAAGLGGPERNAVAPPAGDRFDPEVAPDELAEHAETGPLRVVFVGNLAPRKGLDTLVAGLAASGTDAELTVVGRPADEGYVDRVRAQVADRGLGDRVRFAGELADDDLAAELRASHVLAVPSRYEGFGIVYLEAMSVGLPVVASRAGGATDLVTDGADGFLVDPGDPAAVADALATLSADRDRLAEMGRAARRTYERHPDWSTSVGRVRDLLAAVAGREVVA